MTAPTADQLSNVVRNLQAFTQSAATSQPDTYVWVAPNGSDTTGQRGNLSAPFATVGAALRAAESGDSILIAPGTYPAVVATDFPAALLDVTLIGMGSRDTCVLSDDDGPAFRVTPGTDAERITVRNLGFVTTSVGSSAFIALGPGAGIANNSSVRAENCLFSAPVAPGAVATNLLDFTTENCAGTMQILNCNGGQVEDQEGGEIEVNVTNPVPAHVTRETVRFRGGRLGILSLVGVPFVDADAAVSAFAVTAGTNPTPLGDTASLQFHGEASTVSAVLSGTGSAVLNLDGARVPVLQCTSQVAAPDTQRISARGATIGRAILQNPGGGDLILDTQGGYLGRTDSVFGAACYWDRFGGGDSEVNLDNGANALVFGVDFNDPPYPPGVSVSFTVASATLGTLATDQLAVTAASNAGCTINSGFAAPIVGRVIWHREW